MAGPWVDDRPGHGFIQLSYANYSADRYFAGPGEVDENLKPVRPGTRRNISIPTSSGFITANYKSNYVDQSMLLYGEVSLWRGLGATFSMPVIRYVTQDIHTVVPAKLSELNTGDVTFGLKQQLPRIRALKGFAFGPQLYFTAPTGDVNGRSAYPAAAMLPGAKPLPIPTGNGTFDIEARGSFGYSLYPIPVFFAADVGFRHRLKKASCKFGSTSDSTTYSDDLPWDVQAGGTLAPKKKLSWFDHATLIATLSGLHSFENGDVPGRNGIATKGNPFTQFCGQANNASSMTFGGTLLLFPVKWIGLSYTISHTLTGVNTGYGLSNIVGIATSF
ncbi:MAG: hypothetical protein ABI321_04395 [Polyangia bacterium]